MGAFTHDEKIAQLLFTAGIPVWLIRPIESFTTQNILKVVEPKEPRLCVDVCTHPTVLYKGHAGASAKFIAIQQASHRFALHPDPFEISAFDASSAEPAPEKTGKCELVRSA